MDSALQDLINSYQSGLETYCLALPTENAVVMEARALIASMQSLGEASSDYSAFMEEAQKRNYFNEVIAFYSKLGMEQYKNKPKTTIVPSASEIAKAYHLAYSAMGEMGLRPEIKKVYDLVFYWERESSSGPEFIAHLEEEDLFLQMSRVQLVEVMKAGLTSLLNSGKSNQVMNDKELGVVSSPQMESYFTSMQESMVQASCVIEMEYNAFSNAENSRLSNLWDNAFLFSALHSVLSPLISFRMTDSDEYKADTRVAYQHLNELYGLTWEEVFKIPRIWEIFEKTIFGGIKDSLKNQNIHSASALKGELKRYLDICIKGLDLKLDESKQLVYFRGLEIPMKNVHNALKQAEI